MTASVEVSGPFKVETKPYVITLTGLAKVEDRPLIRTTRSSAPAVEKHYRVKNLILIFVLALVVLGVTAVVIGATVVGFLVLRKKK